MAEPETVPSEMTAHIRAMLTQVEIKHHVRILYACESGSRGWGFESQDSDFDVRFLYIHSASWYLKVLPGRDVIEPPSDGVFDMSGWDLLKALRLLLAGNAQMVEWLDSPIVYRADTRFLERVQAILPKIHRPDRSFHHYLHMASRNHRQYIEGREQVRLKKYLYVLRPVLAASWIIEGRGPAPMPFQSLVDELVTDRGLREAIDGLLARKRAGLESELEAPIPVISTFLHHELERLRRLPVAKGPVPDAAPLDALMLQTLEQTRTDGFPTF